MANINQGADENAVGVNINRIADGYGVKSLASADKQTRALLEEIALSLRQLVMGMSILADQDLSEITE